MENRNLETENQKLSLFFLSSALGPDAASAQLRRLAPALPRDRFRVEVGVIGPADCAASALQNAGVPVHHVPLRHAFDISGVRKLRQLVAAADPAILHAWGPAAARVSRLLTRSRRGGGNIPRVVVSAAANPGGGLFGWLTCRRLRRADRVVPTTWADAERYRRLGVPFEHLTRIGPAVSPPGPLPDVAEFRRGLGLPPDSRLIFAAGRLEPASGLKSAIWAFDMLRYEAADLQLVIFGDGPDRAGLEAFGRALAFDDFRITFAGHRPDLPELLGLAEVVWVTHERGGVNLALEAMAAGRPVVGWKNPDLAEVIEEGENGFLAEPGERAQLAAKTYPLIHEPGFAGKLGAAGRERAATRFTIERMADQFARLYQELG
ncbi:MAG TPA: glycosyltransferase family 4 protein [Gemmataceae bacterium]|nr:glycosyltransferase family 4 protein [Gemmataceae bacterium]